MDMRWIPDDHYGSYTPESTHIDPDVLVLYQLKIFRFHGIVFPGVNPCDLNCVPCTMAQFSNQKQPMVPALSVFDIEHPPVDPRSLKRERTIHGGGGFGEGYMNHTPKTT